MFICCCWNGPSYRNKHLHNLFMIMGHKDTKMVCTFVDHLNSQPEKGGKERGKGETEKRKSMTLADCRGSCFLIHSIGHVTQQQELIILFNHLLDLCQMVSIESAANRERWTASNMPLEVSRKCLRTESNKNLVSEQKGIHLKTMCINYTFPHRILTWHE